MIMNFVKWIKKIPTQLIEKGKKAEREQAARKWDAVVEELKNRK